MHACSTKEEEHITTSINHHITFAHHAIEGGSAVSAQRLGHFFFCDDNEWSCAGWGGVLIGVCNVT